ncbi:MAG: undecaprenyl-diphosphate phosphatase [Candidatus Omnitrophica bacterium]|nr:undecaprenyl-diphosphate phosphatase [Candidatus Omnitrophota bacterium]
MIKYILLGIVQGLTEFLPVSSSGHLVILQNIMGLRGKELATITFLHLATALALVIFFAKDIIKALRDLRLIIFIIIVTFITGVIAITGKDFFEQLFSSVKVVSVSIIVTGIILIFASWLKQDDKQAGAKDAVILGFVQGLAIIPGISRSGTTITTLLFRGLSRQNAFRLSFLAAIPVIIAASLLELKDLTSLEADKINLSAGFIASFISGLFALFFLQRVVKAGKLNYFGFYCLLVGIISLVFLK